MVLNNTWFTSDHHFGHRNIIKYNDRPFGDEYEMDNHLIEQWNRFVAPSDIVYHLGDFTLSNIVLASKIFSQLNGTIFVLKNRWHHDKRWINSPSIDKECRTKNSDRVALLESIYIIEPIQFGNNHPVPIVMCHYPMAQWDRKHYGSWHIHGHSHGTYQAPGLILDVGVDSAAKILGEYRPFSFMEIVEIMVRKNDQEN